MARVGDYSCNGLNCGDRVVLKNDARHVGVVDCISRGVATVQWEETGWISEVGVFDLEYARDEDDLRTFERRFYS